MMDLTKFAGALAATLFLATTAHSQAFEEYSGEATFHRFCASCHGEGARGDGPVSAVIEIGVPDLTLIRRRAGETFPEDVLRRIIDGREAVIYHGTRYMPVWGYEFWLEEGADKEAEKRVEMIIDNLIDYIVSIQR
jgi:mono/diheme cytochrome c family protein